MGKFECTNHQCIDQSMRCNGVRDCDDGFDEYKCGKLSESVPQSYVVISGKNIKIFRLRLVSAPVQGNTFSGR